MDRLWADTSRGSSARVGLRAYAVPLVFCTIALGVSVLLYNRAFSTYDDGVAAEGARLVLQGKVPYRDFWTIYAPGSYYVNALLFAVFGESFFSFRLILPVLVAVQAGFLYGIARRVVTDARFAAAAGVAYLAFVPIGIYITTPLTYWFTATTAVVYFFTRWIESPAAKWEYACGISLGVATLFRQDGGLYTAAVLLAMVPMVAPRVNAARGPAVLRMFGSFGGVLALAAAYFASKGALAALSAMSVRRLMRGKMNNVEIAAAAICCLALVLFVMVRVRPIPMRILGSVVLGLMAFAALGSDRGKMVRIAAVSMLAASIVAYVPFAVSTVIAHRRYGSALLVGKGGIRVGGGYADMISIVSSYVREHTAPSEKILAGTPAIYLPQSATPPPSTTSLTRS